MAGYQHFALYCGYWAYLSMPLDEALSLLGMTTQ
jgi:hypothetical protein